MTDDLLVDPHTLRQQVRDKYRDVALDPHAEHHFHTGRPLAARWVTSRPSSTPSRAASSSRSPESGIPFPCDRWRQANAWSTSVPALGSTRSSPPGR